MLGRWKQDRPMSRAAFEACIPDKGAISPPRAGPKASSGPLAAVPELPRLRGRSWIGVSGG